ncbi:MAG TPA: amidohydrolase family protein [Luteolibacter sp.]|nr:amidohydrolase family protein [Luteolibacter sp.]
MKIDSHHHLWAINDTDYVWMTEAHAVIRRDFLAPELDAVLDESGIDGTVAVQARQMVEETEFLLAFADANPRVRGVVGWVPLLENGGEPWLEKYATHPKLRGVRHVVHDEPDDDFILRPDFNEGIRNLPKYGLLYDILIFWKHLPQTIRFVDLHPEQPFVVDHIAKPRIAREAFDNEWAAGIRELAKREHVSCKISGMITEVRDAEWDADLLRPYFDTILEAFGPQRVMYGSDWPVCLLRGSYANWVHAVEQLASSLSLDEQAALWGGNAERIYQL